MNRLVAALLLAVATAAHAGPLYEQKILSSGLTVLVVPRHAVPLVTVEIAAHSGAMTEPPEWNGLSHLYEHMFFKANAKVRDQAAFMKRLRALGIEFNGTTSNERVSYYFTTTSDHFDGALALLHDAITSPAFDETELAKERAVVTGELDRDESKPTWQLRRAVEERLWWKYLSRKQAGGRRETVLAATPAMMRAIGARYFVPNNAILVVSGDVDPATTFAAVEQRFADWPPSSEDPFVRFPLVDHPPVQKSSVVVVERPVSTVTVEMAWQGPSNGGLGARASSASEVDDSYVMELLETLANLPNGPLQKALVRPEACVHARLNWEPARNVGALVLTLAATPAHLDTCLQRATAAVESMGARGYFGTASLVEALQIIEEQMVLQRERPSELAHHLTRWWALAGLDYYARYWPRLQAVTTDEVARVAHRYLSRPFVTGVLAAPSMHVDAGHVSAIVAGAPR